MVDLQIVPFADWIKSFKESKCNECGGGGMAICHECRSEIDCNHCGGYGILHDGKSREAMLSIYNKQCEDELRKYKELTSHE